MRKILHLPFPDKTDAILARPADKPVRWHFDPDVTDPVLGLDAGKTEGGARRIRP